jgi:hypothetical protein
MTGLRHFARIRLTREMPPGVVTSADHLADSYRLAPHPAPDAVGDPGVSAEGARTDT